MNNLQEFMLLFRMQPSNQQPTADQIATMQLQWQKFIGGIASQTKLVSVSRLDFVGAIINGDQSVSHSILLENEMTMSGNLVMKAETLEDAIETAKQCPILFVNGQVEVRPTIPMN